MTKVFEENLAIYAEEHPSEAVRLHLMDKSPYKRIGKNNLKMPWGTLYDQDPDQEAEDWFKAQSLEGIQLLYVYGIGLGSYYFPLKKWLHQDPNRHILFIEDDRDVLKMFLESEKAKEVLLDPQVTVGFVKDAEDEESALTTVFWSHVMVPFTVLSLKSYAEHKTKSWEEFKYRITYRTTIKNGLLDEYLLYGVVFYHNFYPNILKLHESHSGNALFNQFKGIPAIICGAGPSLEKQIPLLKTLQDKALIFAGGSARTALASHGLQPHFGAGLDPNSPQMSRLMSVKNEKVPFFYRARFHHPALDLIAGEKLYISGAGGYDIAEWYEEQFNIKGKDFFDEGRNVVNFCTEIAGRLGCNPIIYVGMDLAYTNLKSYASGVIANDTISEKKLLEEHDEHKKGIWRNDIHGKPVLTHWKWIAESDWFQEYAENHPDAKLINATEGGIGFPDIPNMTLKDAVKKYLKKTYPLKDLIKKAIKKAEMPQVTKNKLLELTQNLRSSLLKCVDYLNILYEELKKEKVKKDTDGSVKSGRFALTEIELFDEPAYKYILDIFHQVKVRLQNKRMGILRMNKNNALSPEQIAQEKIQLQIERLEFLHNVAQANIALIDHTLK